MMSLITLIDAGDYIFSFDDLSIPFSLLYEGTTNDHGERIYCHNSGKVHMRNVSLLVHFRIVCGDMVHLMNYKPKMLIFMKVCCC